MEVSDSQHFKLQQQILKVMEVEVLEVVPEEMDEVLVEMVQEQATAQEVEESEVEAEILLKETEKALIKRIML